jgi:four helix bundle protein
VKDHRKLRAFQLADQFALSAYQVTSALPNSELFGLTGQIRRAAVSAASNIVEGCSRTSQPDYLRFLEVAHGSLREAGYQLSLAARLGYLAQQEYRSIHKEYQEASKALAALINKIRSEL